MKQLCSIYVERPVVDYFLAVSMWGYMSREHYGLASNENWMEETAA
jgi:hypothetical protein